MFEILSKISDIPRHSRLVLSSFAAHFLSRIWFCFNKLSSTLLVFKSWDSIFVNLSLDKVSYAFVFGNILSNSFWYSSTIFDNSSLINFLNVFSDIAIANLKLQLKKSPLQLKNRIRTTDMRTDSSEKRKSAKKISFSTTSKILLFAYQWNCISLSFSQILALKCLNNDKTLLNIFRLIILVNNR